MKKILKTLTIFIMLLVTISLFRVQAVPNNTYILVEIQLALK